MIEGEWQGWVGGNDGGLGEYGGGGIMLCCSGNFSFGGDGVTQQDDRVGSIKDVSVRGVWRNEAHDFTPWLSRNLERLGQALHLDLEPLGSTEVPVGRYSLDILAQEAGPNGRKVAIENQLEGTDHGHLGQLLTYAAGHKAEVAIWVAPHFTEEHRAAIDWLNELTLDKVEFYGVQVSAIQIDDSKPAPIFNPVAVPERWPRPKQQARARKETAGGFGIGVPGVLLYTEIGERESYVELWIAPDRKLPGYLETKHRIFNALEADKAAIEQEFAEGELRWLRQGKRHYAEIRLVKPASINDPPEKLAETRAWLEDTRVKFREVFNPRVGKILAEMEVQESGE